MDGNCNGGFWFEQRVGDFVASPPIMSYAAESLLRLQDIHTIPCSSANGLNSFLSSAWNPLVAMPHHHPVDSPIMVSSLDVLKCNQVVTGDVSHCNYPEEKDMRGAKMAAHLTDEGGEHETSSEEKIPVVAVERKRKRIPDTGDAKVCYEFCFHFKFHPNLLEVFIYSTFKLGLLLVVRITPRKNLTMFPTQPVNAL